MNTKKKYGNVPYTGLDESDEPDYRINAFLYEPPSPVPAVAGSNMIGDDDHDTILTGGGDEVIDTNVVLNIISSEEDDYLNGTDADEYFYAWAGNDTIYGYAGNDTMWGYGGNDTINGGDGEDTAVYTGNFSNYTINYNPTASASSTVIDTIAGRDGNDTYAVSETELFQFADGTKTANELQSSGGSGGTAGMVTTDFGREDYGFSMALQADGKIIVAGTANNGTDYDFALARYTSTGMLDTTFDGDGKKIDTVSGLNDNIESITVDSDGNIYAAGKIENAFAVVSYYADGRQRMYFKREIGEESYATSVIVQSDGKIVVAGMGVINGSKDFALVRLTSDGMFDTTFSGDGVATAHFGGDDYAQAVIQQADGKIVVAGLTDRIGSDDDFALVRYNSNGTPDTTFNGDGVMFFGFFADEDDHAYDVIQQADGKIVVAGVAYNGSNWDFALARLNSNRNSKVRVSGDTGVSVPS